jgi:cytochrome b
VWGVIGDDNARWKRYLFSPVALVQYIKGLFSSKPLSFLGHNPAGSYMVLALLGLILATAVSGLLLQGAEEFTGVMHVLAAKLNTTQVHWLEELHEFCANAVIGLAVFHVLDVIFSSWRYRANLAASMITGTVSENNIKIILPFILITNVYAQNLDMHPLYQSWTNSAAYTPDATQGKALWNQNGVSGYSCASCHNTDLRTTRQHVKTRKRIEPLSPAINPKRLTNTKKINKWLTRNCRFVYKRDCSVEEKINFIEYIQTQ